MIPIGLTGRPAGRTARARWHRRPRRPHCRAALILVPLALLLAACGGGAVALPAPATHPLPAPTTHPLPAPTASTTACSTAATVASWPLARRAAQLVVVPVEETAVASIAPSVAAGVGGIILYGSVAPADLGSALAQVEAGAPGEIKPFVMTDEEGGEVQRMANLVGNLPWARTMAQTMTGAQVEALATQTAKAMAANGVTMDLAPDLDLASGPGPDALHVDGPRSFSPLAATATGYGLAFARGLQVGGVIPVVKHFPGEGSASANTDDAPATLPPLSQLEAADLRPFEAAIAAHLPAIMIGNATVPGLTTGPASLSPAALSFLRHTLGFSGLVMTDSLSAGAISGAGYSTPQAAAAAIEAGVDMVLFNSTTPNSGASAIVSAIEAAVTAGQLPLSQLDQAVATVLATKGVSLCPS